MKNTNSFLQWFAKTVVLLVAITMLAAPLVTFAGNNPQSNNSISDIAGKVNEDLNEIEGKIAGTALAVIPIALLVAVIGMCITQDGKKVAMLLKVCGTILLAAGAITLITRDYALKIIETLVERFFG